MPEKKILRTVILSDALPYEGTGTFFHYGHVSAKVDGWVFCDVREIIGLHEDQWISELDTWHRKLNSRAIELAKWWYLLPASRLMLWTASSFSLKSLFFTLAVIDWLNRSPLGNVWIVGATNAVAEYLAEWGGSGKLIRIVDRREAPQRRGERWPFIERLKFWPRIVKQLGFIISSVAFRKRARVGSATVIVNSLVLNPALLRTKGDHFFGHMLDSLEGLSEQKMLWIYHDMAVDKKTRSELSAIRKRAHFIMDFFRWTDLFFALRTALGMRKALKSLVVDPLPFRSGELVTPGFSVNFVNTEAVQAIPLFELVLYRLWGRILKEVGASSLIYPYEEKPMERAILFAVRDFAPQTRTVGFAHAAYSKGHLYLRRANYGEPPRPNFVAATGEIALQNFLKAGVPVGQIVVTGSPRHSYAVSARRSNDSNLRKKILLLTGHGFELKIFADMLENERLMFEKYDLAIRRYPYAWVAEQDAAEAKMRSAGILYRSLSGDLSSQIDESDIVLFESTSAGMEAILRGKMAIRLNLSDVFSTSHFYGARVEKEVIKYCRDVKDLKNQLKYIESLTKDQYTAAVCRQRELVEELYSPVKNAVVTALLTRTAF